MPGFARQLLAWILLAIAFLMEGFWSLIGLAAITFGAYQVYRPAGWIVGGVLLLLASEFHFGFAKAAPITSGANSGAI